MAHQMSEKNLSQVRISSVKFTNFKALKNYSISLNETNILVGPNNAGKSTIISAFRILDTALRKARRLSAERVPSPNGSTNFGHRVPNQQINVSLENVATDYNTDDSKIEFRLTNRNKFFLFFPSEGGCFFHWENNSFGVVNTPGKFRKAFPINIQAVPVLGPLEHEESLVNKDTVKSALNTHRACRHFRSYWHYFNEGWNDFAEMISSTWPNMDISKPEWDMLSGKLSMFVSEARIPREIYWAGFGFQIWCQLLTHLSRAGDASIVIIDEPEIYLHPDVQRQLLSILRRIDADILLATHSVEIMGEADPSEILLVDKGRRSAKRLKDIKGIQVALETLGSTQNITLTHLARTKKILFVEGMSDYTLVRRFAKNLGFHDLASGNDLTAFESGGFSSWEKIKSFAWGVKNTMDADMMLFAIYDRDYCCQEEANSILDSLKSELTYAHIHQRKEMENYFLVIPVLERVLDRQIEIRRQRTGEDVNVEKSIREYLDKITNDLKSDAQSQYIAKRINYHQRKRVDTSTISREAIEDFERLWVNIDSRMGIVHGKKTIKLLRNAIQEDYKVNLSDVQIINQFRQEEIPDDLLELVNQLEVFRASKP